ncbi:MAG TPA: TonB-dependent receptor, partial [Roseiflexaceae bacterium]|nr:TonB-dependent receptor [Roseiflexaceae bacterium]
DRTHYFLAYEGNFQDLETRVNFNPPTGLPALADSLLSGEGLYGQPLRSHLFFGRLDHQLRDDQTLMLSVNVRNDRDDRDFGGGRTEEGRNRIDNDVNTVLVRHTWNAAPFINEAQVSVQRFRWAQTPSRFGDPQVEFPQYGITRGANRSYQDFTQDRLALRNDLTWTRGRHILKGGVGIDFLRYDIDKRLDETPVFRFRTDNPCGLSCPYEATVQIGDPDLETTNQQLGAYIQDDWQATSRLVLNLGVRWDFETDQLNNEFATPRYAQDSVRAFLQNFPFFDADDYITSGVEDRPRFYGAFQPRVGFSYDFTGDARTVVFGGAGLFYDRNNYNAILDEKYKVQRLNYTFRFSPGGSVPGTIAWDPSYFSREGLVGLVESGTFAKPEVWLLENDTRPPRSVQASLGLRRMLGDVQLSVTGSMTHNYNGLRWMWGHRDPVTGNQQWGANGMSAILISTDDAETRYRALLFSVNRPLREEGRWGGGIHYTLSKTETNTFFEEDMFAFDYVRPEDFEWVPGRFDERHRVSANLVVRLPYRFLVSTV